MSNGSFLGKVALVTGGGSGIGRSTALALAAEGAIVCVADIDGTSARNTVEVIAACGGRGASLQCNAASAIEVEALIAEIARSHGRLDMAVNNVGGAEVNKSIVTTTEEKWDQIIELNLKSAWLAMKFEIPEMERVGGGSIVNVASMAGVSPMIMASPAYAAAKAGVIHLTRYAARAYADASIRVNAVAPGLTRTPLVASHFDEEAIAAVVDGAQFIKRAAEPEEVTAAILFLLAPSSAMITGMTIPVTGGVP